MTRWYWYSAEIYNKAIRSYRNTDWPVFAFPVQYLHWIQQVYRWCHKPDDLSASVWLLPCQRNKIQSSLPDWSPLCAGIRGLTNCVSYPLPQQVLPVWFHWYKWKHKSVDTPTGQAQRRWAHPDRERSCGIPVSRYRIGRGYLVLLSVWTSDVSLGHVFIINQRFFEPVYDKERKHHKNK